MIRLPLKERQPLRVVVERMAAKGHRISHIVERVEQEMGK
jgi:hypothetical protein